MPDTAKNLLPDSNQVSLARELGVVVEENASTDFVVARIDEVLAEKSIEEQTRWFVLSVLRHLALGQWSEPGASNLELLAQYSLARECLAIDGFKKSLTTVLKDKRCLFTLLTFGKSKDTKKNILSSATKAYKIAANVVSREELLLNSKEASDVDPAEDLLETPASKNKELDTAVNRRAGRRGYLSAELQAIADASSAEKITTRKAQISSMGEKEFLDLEAAIESNTQTPEQHQWNYRSNEDRWSLLLGLAAGVGFFSLVLILFL